MKKSLSTEVRDDPKEWCTIGDTEVRYQVRFTNRRVWEFYANNRGMDAEAVNVCVVEMLEKMQDAGGGGLGAGTAAHILEALQSVRGQIGALGDSVARVSGEQTAGVAARLTEFRREYLEDMNRLLLGHTADKIAPLIERSGEAMRDKTQLLIGDLLARTQDMAARDIAERMQAFRESVAGDVRALSGGAVSSEALAAFASGIDDKFSRALAHHQTVLNSVIASSEQRLSGRVVEAGLDSARRLEEVRGLAATGAGAQTALHGSVGELLRKFDNSSSKGRLSENLLMGVLQGLYPAAQLEYVGASKECGDIMLSRRGRPVVLFENKCYDVNVGRAEVDKFYRDVEAQHCCGILLSQRTCVVNKGNFEIELCAGKTVVFMHEVEYSPDKIRAAVDIIDHFQKKVEDLEARRAGTAGVWVDPVEMEAVSREYQEFAVARLNSVRTIKECCQKMVLQAEAIKMPGLERMLARGSPASAGSKNPEYVCMHCGYIAKNRGGLSAHLRRCAKRLAAKADAPDESESLL